MTIETIPGSETQYLLINQGSGAVGAHSDIAKPAVAHAFWQAIETA